MIERLKNWLLPSIADAFFITLLLFLSFPTDKARLLGDGDTGYHIRAGEYILSNLTVPKADIFSYITPTMPWTAHEWLSEVIMALLHQLGGLTALVIAFSLIIAVTTRMFYTNTRRDGNNVILAVVATIIFLMLAMVHFLARPHIFSLVILLIWYRLLNDYQYRQENRLWLLPFIILLWVNLHGGFVIGLAILGLYIAANLILKFTDRDLWEASGKVKCRNLLRIFGLSTLACLVNPIGYHIFLFPVKLLSNTYIMDRVGEFLSPNFHELQPFKYVLFLLIIIVAYSKKKPDFIEMSLMLLFTSMSLYSIRYIPLFALIVIPILLRQIDGNLLGDFPRIERFIQKRLNNITAIDNSAKGYLWPALGVLLLMLLVGNGTIAHSFDRAKQPVAALEFLKENPVAGNMFNNDEFGDFVIYFSHDQYKVFIDGRLDMYGSERLKEYNKISSFEPEWEKVIDKYHITWIFFDTKSSFARFLSINNDWHLIYSDKVASIFVRDIPSHKRLVEKFPSVKLANYSTGTRDGS